MSMLAGPRRKQKVINLRAKNNAWSNDNNKFGQRMLEKMGWSSGKGLGAKENGIVEHVVAKYKNDDRGLGFEDKNDQWTKHEDDFNALLANLSNADSNEEKLHSGVSLEVKSKKSKARIHYHKFTRGKDIARYSEKDLANIFGKKSLKNEEKVEESLVEDDITTEKVFTEKGSMEDYFKNKMAAFNSKNKLSLENYNESKDEEADYTFKGFAATADDAEPENDHQGFGFQPFSFYGSSENKDKNTEPVPDQDCTEIVKKNKKNKKSKKEVSSENYCSVSPVVVTEGTEHLSNELESGQLSVEKVRKSKKKKISEEELPNDTEQVVPKKKKSKKNNDTPKPEEVQEQNTDQDIHVPKKKKKRKNKDM